MRACCHLRLVSALYFIISIILHSAFNQLNFLTDNFFLMRFNCDGGGNDVMCHQDANHQQKEASCSSVALTALALIAVSAATATSSVGTEQMKSVATTVRELFI
jgi:hypothetical protein